MTLLIYLCSTCDPLIMGECKINCLLYADDLILLFESESGLTKAITFNKRDKILRSEFKIGNQPIQVTDDYVNLVIT